MLGRTHEKQWIRRSESTSAKREWIWIYEYTAFECVLRLNTPQTNRYIYDWVSCSWYILDKIVFNNYICIIIIETLPLFPSYITYQLYKYILWTWAYLSYYINTFITHYCIRLNNVYTSIYIWYMYIQPWQKLLNHHEVLWKLISISNDHCLLKISILCCCYLWFVNIIPKVLWKSYITWPSYAYSVSHKKKHSGPIISSMAVCICMASAVHC